MRRERRVTDRWAISGRSPRPDTVDRLAEQVEVIGAERTQHRIMIWSREAGTNPEQRPTNRRDLPPRPNIFDLGEREAFTWRPRIARGWNALRRRRVGQWIIGQEEKKQERGRGGGENCYHRVINAFVLLQGKLFRLESTIGPKWEMQSRKKRLQAKILVLIMTTDRHPKVGG